MKLESVFCKPGITRNSDSEMVHFIKFKNAQRYTKCPLSVKDNRWTMEYVGADNM